MAWARKNQAVLVVGMPFVCFIGSSIDIYSQISSVSNFISTIFFFACALNHSQAQISESMNPSALLTSLEFEYITA